MPSIPLPICRQRVRSVLSSVFDETLATICSVATKRRPVGRLRRLVARHTGNDGERRVRYVGRLDAGPGWLCPLQLCFRSNSNAPAEDGGRQKPSPAPQCPFCFSAAQSAGHIATIGEAPAFPAYADLLSAAILDPIGAGAFVFQFRHRHGESRAPPAFSV